MVDKAWKRCEREIAAKLGGERVPVSGRQRGDVPDIRHPWLSPEVKSRRQGIPALVREALAQAYAAATPEQLPIAIIHDVGSRHDKDVVCLYLEDFLDWFGGQKPEGK